MYAWDQGRGLCAAHMHVKGAARSRLNKMVLAHTVHSVPGTVPRIRVSAYSNLLGPTSSKRLALMIYGFVSHPEKT